MDDFRLMLAPMEDLTGGAFRTLCHRHGADLTFTEMVRVNPLAKKNKATWAKLEFRDDTPVVVQLLGAKEEHFERFLSMFKPHEGFLGFNLNLGCPSPDVMKLGQGCALVRRISKTARIVSLMKKSGFPVSVKMRLGINQLDKEYKVYLKILQAIDADYFIVHARHGAQTYENPADFGIYPECVQTGKEIIANGDIRTKGQINYLKEAGVAGAMIGRAAVADPSIFSKLKSGRGKPLEEIRDEFLKLIEDFGETPKYRNNILKHMGKAEPDFRAPIS